MPLPGEMRPARLVVTQHDLAWDGIYSPLTRSVQFVAGQVNRMQFLTIRQYLSVVFLALILLLTVLAIWG
jgi:hydrogenase-4 component B